MKEKFDVELHKGNIMTTTCRQHEIELKGAMSNVVSMREQALDPAVIESIVIKGRSIRLEPDAEGGVLQLQMPAGRFRPRRKAI
jgi:hypothetical protein